MLFDLLVMKTQGWWHHLISPRKVFQAKVKAEIVDVYAPLDLALEEGVGYNDVRAVSAVRHGESMEWAPVPACRIVRRHRRRGKWTLPFRNEKHGPELRLPCSPPVLRIEFSCHSTFIVLLTIRGPVPDAICIKVGQPIPRVLVMVGVFNTF